MSEYRDRKFSKKCDVTGCPNGGKYLISGKVLLCETHNRQRKDESNTGWNTKKLNEIQSRHGVEQ